MSVHPTTTTTATMTTIATNTATTAIRATSNNATMRTVAEEKHKKMDIIAKQAMEIATTNVDGALEYMKNHLSWNFLHNSQSFVFTCHKLIFY